MEGLPRLGSVEMCLFMATQVDNAREPLSAPIGSWRARRCGRKTLFERFHGAFKAESSRSIQVRTKARGMSYSVQ